MATLGFNRYGKAEVRVVSVRRDGATHHVLDRNVSMSLSGEMDAVYRTGDNSAVLATDTQKNTAYAFAKSHGPLEAEAYARALAEHFVASQPTIARGRVEVDEYGWDRIGSTGHSFVRGGGEVRTTIVVHDQVEGLSVVSGVKDMIVMNTTDSEFWGFLDDPYTTLPPTTDRILATQVSALWRFRPDALDSVDWATAYADARGALLEAFAGTYSYSLQQTIYAIGEAIMAAVPQVCEVRLVLPNKHHFLVDLAPFGLENGNEVYYAADRPYGLIEGEILADDAPAPGLAWS